MTGRQVTLVVVDGDGEVVGQTEPLAVATPWWPELSPIVALCPDLTILRLLDARPAANHVMGGSARYVAQWSDPAVRVTHLVGCDGKTKEAVVKDHPLRLPWARPGGPAAELGWALEHVTPNGPPLQFKSWNLSSLWCIPTAGGRVWLKSVPPFFEHEASVIRALSRRGASVPRVLASAGHRMLLEDLPGQDGFGASIGEHRRIIDVLVEILGDQPERDITTGVPDWRRDALWSMATSLLERRPSPIVADQLLAGWHERWARIEECGLGDGMIHGDPHPGNARIGVEPPVIFDWGDSGLGHPLLDLAVLDEVDDEVAAGLQQHWLDRWSDRRPGCDPHQAWRHLRPIAILRAALVFQRFLDNIEPSEHIYHRHDVPRRLARTEQVLARSPS